LTAIILPADVKFHGVIGMREVPLEWRAPASGEKCRIKQFGGTRLGEKRVRLLDGEKSGEIEYKKIIEKNEGKDQKF